MCTRMVQVGAVGCDLDRRYWQQSLSLGIREDVLSCDVFLERTGNFAMRLRRDLSISGRWLLVWRVERDGGMEIT